MLLNPGSLVIGASAASSGLMAAATALRPKQAIFLALFICALALLFIGPASEYFTSSRKTQVSGDVATLAAQNQQAQTQLSAAKTVVGETSARATALEQQGKTQQATRERAILAQQQASLAQAEKQAAEANELLAQAQAKAADLARGEAQANEPVSAVPHAVGALVGLVIVMAFRKNDVDENLRLFKEWLGRTRANAGI
jgi:hypothetical protein